MTVEQVLFYLFALGAIAGCSGVVLSRNPVNSAVSLVAAFFFLAGNYVLLHANFMAIVQILVYAGAIMVLFLFVLMLLNQRDEELGKRTFSIAPLLGIFAAAVVSVSIGAGFMSYRNATASFPADVPVSFGTAQQIGRALMTTHLLPFELVSLLLLIGIVSAVVVAKRRL